MTSQQINMILRSIEQQCTQNKKPCTHVVMVASGNEYVGMGSWFDTTQTIFMLTSGPDVPPLYLDVAFIVGFTYDDGTAKVPANNA